MMNPIFLPSPRPLDTLLKELSMSISGGSYRASFDYENNSPLWSPRSVKHSLRHRESLLGSQFDSPAL